MILTVWIRLLSAMPICRIKSRKVIGSSTILLITPPGGLLYSRIPYCYYVFRGSKSGGQSFMTILPKKNFARFYQNFDFFIHAEVCQESTPPIERNIIRFLLSQKNGCVGVYQDTNFHLKSYE